MPYPPAAWSAVLAAVALAATASAQPSEFQGCALRPHCRGGGARLTPESAAHHAPPSPPTAPAAPSPRPSPTPAVCNAFAYEDLWKYEVSPGLSLWVSVSRGSSQPPAAVRGYL